MKSKTNRGLTLREATVALVLPAIFCLIFPALVYRRNIGAVPFAIADTWHLLVGVYVIAVGVAAGGLWVLRRLWFPRAAVSGVALTFCVWIQGTFVTYNLGSLDGHPIDWSAFRSGHVLEVGLWFTLLAGSYLLRKRIYESIGTVVFVLVVATGWPLVLSPGGEARPTAHPDIKYFDEGGQFEMSAERNVVVIVVDTARADAFEQILQRRTDIAKAFRGFTMFQDATGGFSITKPSIPLILSGVYFENRIPYPEYMKEAAPRSIPAVLRRQGYRAEYYSFSPFAFLDHWDNATTEPSEKEIRASYRKLVNVTLLRYSPLVLKRFAMDYYYGDAAFWGKDMVEFAAGLKSMATVHKRPVFKFIHLTGAHPLFLLDRELKRTDRGQYLDQLEGAMAAIAQFVEQLRNKGLYSKSALFVVGDHGSTEAWSVDEPLQSGATTAMLNGMPMLLAKDFGADEEPLRIDEKPVALADIAASVFDAAKIAVSGEGVSIFAPGITGRKRPFYFYNHWQQKWTADYLPLLYRFEIDGPVRERRSWRFTGTAMGPAGRVESVPLHYNFGTNLVAPDEVFVELSSLGFREEHRPGAWATGPVSTFHLSVDRTNAPIALSYDFSPFLEGGRLPVQRLLLSIDGREIAALRFAEATAQGRVSIPDSGELTADGELEVTLAFPDAVASPRDLGQSNDFRTYAGFFRRLSLDLQQQSLLPLRIDFGTTGQFEHFRGPGWASTETAFTWTASDRAEMQIGGNEAFAGALNLRIAAFPFTGRGRVNEQTVMVMANGKEVGVLTVANDGIYMLRLPAQAGRNLLRLEFRPGSPMSPASLGMSNDARRLGIAVRWMQIEPAGQ